MLPAVHLCDSTVKKDKNSSCREGLLPSKYKFIRSFFPIPATTVVQVDEAGSQAWHEAV